MKLLVAPQEFKGSLTSAQAARAIASGIAEAKPEWVIDVAPLADGGPGTVEAFLSARRGQRKTTLVEDPLGRPVEAGWALLEDGTAIIEMAAASGLNLLAEAEYAPLAASSFGTGALVRAALDAGAARVLVGAGGSATTDGGAGAAMALGARLFDAKGLELPRTPGALARLARLDVSGVDPRLAQVPVQVITDVHNPLCGPEGAAQVYGPQKGADAETCELLDAGLARLAATVEAQLGKKLATLPGSGAGGGLGYGLAALCGATISSGFDAVAGALGLFAPLTWW
jgi:glycerate kinase